MSDHISVSNSLYGIKEVITEKDAAHCSYVVIIYWCQRGDEVYGEMEAWKTMKHDK